MNYIDTNNCGQSFHYFLRDADGKIQLYHSDDSLCPHAEFDVSEMLDGEVEREVECPGCGKNPADHDHIRACIGYKTPYTEAEIRDSLSDPTEHTKRDALLKEN